jgi:glucokinase
VTYLESVREKPTRACFAAAGPVINDEVDFSNSQWTLRKSDIAGPLGLDEFLIVNDFYALAAGVGLLRPEAYVVVKGGAPQAAAPQLVVGPGTGFGQALIVPTRDGPKIVATEGGHVAFAPRNDREIAISRFIASEHPRVSVERLLSGQGLVNIYRALCAIENVERDRLEANEITAAATDRSDPISVEAVDIFCAALGRVVGDAVLATGSRGGVFLAGGILPKIRETFLNSAFVDKFTDKGRMREYVANVPVKLIVEDGAALYGAAAALVTPA